MVRVRGFSLKGNNMMGYKKEVHIAAVGDEEILVAKTTNTRMHVHLKSKQTASPESTS